MNTGILLAHVTFALLVFLLFPTKRHPLWVKLSLLFGAGLASFIVIDDLSLGDYTRSYTANLAVTNLLWIGWCALCRFQPSLHIGRSHKLQLALCFVGLAIVLYPATLGMLSVDPYRMGFSPALLFSVMGCVCLWLWWQHNHLALGLIMLATLAYLVDVKDSDNYWDYLIDPILAIYCGGYLLKHAIVRLRSQLNAKQFRIYSNIKPLRR